MTPNEDQGPAWPPIVFPVTQKAIAQRILRETCKRHGISEAAATGTRRIKPFVQCRTEAIALIAKETTLNLSAIARIMSKDHTTIILAIRRYNEETGENVRNLGHVPVAQRERNRASIRKRKMLLRQETAEQRLRRNDLKYDREGAR